VLSRSERALVFALLSIPKVFAQDPLYNDAPPNTNIFTPTVIPPGATFTPQPPSLQVDIDHESGWFYIKSWMARGKLIRSGSGPNATEYCLGNLSLALSSLGSLNGAEYGGAAGALSLLPTAGALIGSPTKELWVVYKLMPLAGLLSMFLSLGGTMVPTQAGAYDPKVSFTYGGMIATPESRVKSDISRRPRRREQYRSARPKHSQTASESGLAIIAVEVIEESGSALAFRQSSFL